MYHSDLDDSAESSSNDESPSLLPNMPGVSFDSTAGGPSNTSKKVLKMVDKIAESKLFQAATDNRYIKNLMEGMCGMLGWFASENVLLFRRFQH